MFPKHVNTTLLCGSKELSKSFMFEAATYWAEEGQRVAYITPMPLESQPAACHDRSNPTVTALKLMRFIYLSDYEALVGQLFKLHTYAAVPSVILIDSLDNYLNFGATKSDDSSTRIAKVCASILHSAKACSRVLKKNVHVCIWSSSNLINNFIRTMYFRNVWHLTEKEDGKMIVVEKFPVGSLLERSYVYHKFEDGIRVLAQILYHSID
ncbi:hypothetical protein PUN28_003072 [Cardiocondyla obscurior]|uniref:Uncharacterized protein n=1 Tax=Cardiocondyla obscurior TaxID=286306 RepID=A0AAW2GJ03_9HYME